MPRHDRATPRRTKGQRRRSRRRLARLKATEANQLAERHDHHTGLPQGWITAIRVPSLLDAEGGGPRSLLTNTTDPPLDFLCGEKFQVDGGAGGPLFARTERLDPPLESSIYDREIPGGSPRRVGPDLPELASCVFSLSDVDRGASPGGSS